MNKQDNGLFSKNSPEKNHNIETPVFGLSSEAATALERLSQYYGLARSEMLEMLIREHDTEILKLIKKSEDREVYLKS